MVRVCTCYGQDVDRHDPVFVEEREGGRRVPAGQFPNYVCLRAHVAKADLAVGAACAFDPGRDSADSPDRRGPRSRPTT